jgi:chemotaxis protein methyltransferase CheR
MPELGIVDIREIIRALKSDYDFDFGNYALTSFKQRLERIMVMNNIGSADKLIGKFRDETGFFDTFLHELTVPATEMFRDPSLWRWLREEYFPVAIDKNTARFKIWLPGCVSGAELYSLIILLSESGLMEKVQIIASCLSDKSIEIIKTGSYDLKKMEVSEENYKRFNGSKELSAYYKIDKNCAFRDRGIIEHVEFRKLNVNFDNAPQNIRLILFRNSMIYFNSTQQEKVLKIIYDSLSVSGHFIIGIREKISGMSMGWDYEVVNETESVYRKRLLN